MIRLTQGSSTASPAPTSPYVCTFAAVLAAAAIKALIEPPLNAELDALDVNGYTALMICTFCDRAAAADLLVKAGAEVRARKRGCAHLQSSVGILAQVQHDDRQLAGCRPCRTSWQAAEGWQPA